MQLFTNAAKFLFPHKITFTVMSGRLIDNAL